jgi:two-component system invasion response regulator UvrY
VAIADDQVLFREGITHIINGFDNFKIDISVNNGKQLLEKLSACKNQPDICIFEINMPEMNGYETLISLKEKWPTLKVLILSSYSNEFAITKMLKGGATGYLLKSSSTFDLNKALNSIYTHGSYYPDSFSVRLIGLLQNREPLPLLTDRELQFLSLCPTPCPTKTLQRSCL